MAKIIINQQLRRVELKGVEIANEIVFEYFNSLPTDAREERFFEALYIGVLAQMQERLSSFLTRTSDELGARLESLKMIFELKKELFYKSAVKGAAAEADVAAALRELCERRGFDDSVELVGAVRGELGASKKGDIVATLPNAERLVIECKFNKSVRVGDFAAHDIFAAARESVFGELLEARANRCAHAAIIVFDAALVERGVTERFENVGFVAGVGFVAVIDSQKGDFTNLAIAYSLAREMAMARAFRGVAGEIAGADVDVNANKVAPNSNLDENGTGNGAENGENLTKNVAENGENSNENSTQTTPETPTTNEFDGEVLAMIIARIVCDLRGAARIKTLVETNIKTNREILAELQKRLISLEFTQRFFEKFLRQRTLTPAQLLEFYRGHEAKLTFEVAQSQQNKTEI